MRRNRACGGVPCANAEITMNRSEIGMNKNEGIRQRVKRFELHLPWRMRCPMIPRQIKAARLIISVTSILL